ncbi:MAG: PH domain-containing protein [Rickettsiales bacterium]
MPTIAEVWKQIDALPVKYIFYTRKEVRYLPKILAEDERILAVTSGFMQNRTWLVACTSKRVIFLDRGMFFGLRQFQLNLDRIQSIDSSFGLAFGTIRVYDGASAMQIGLVLKYTIAPFVKIVQEAMDRYKRTMVFDIAAAATKAQHSAPDKADFIHELERLSKLKADGHLNDAEYSAAKAKLLG